MLLGRDIGPFVIDKEIGAGAMGSVFRGRHRKNGQKVAIKLIAPGLASNQQAMERFKREIFILKQLSHPHIVKLLASGKLHGTPFYVMEFIEGESLDLVMERRGRITWEELVPMGQQLCSALQYAHDKGIIHRDLKPSNLMMLKDGTLKLTDFGIAKDTDVTALTAANSTVGTAAYMSPEQCRGVRELTHKSDLYSMGVMFYELITGKKPFVGDSAMQVFTLHLTGTFPRPSRLVMELPIWLDTLICQLMEKEPEKRPYNASTVSQSLGMIKQKVESQQSAGIEAAKKRRADRTDHDVRLDDEDKDLARALLGKKRKRRKVAVYQKGWFTVLALAVILAAFGVGAYLAFFKAPTAAALYGAAQELMKSSERKDREEARQTITTFMELYPDHPKVEEMQGWADAIDLEICERAMHNRRNARFQPDGAGERLAREALDSEDLGKSAQARSVWQELAEYKKKTDPDLRAWGLVAGKYLDELAAIDDLLAELQSRVALEKQGGKKALGDTKVEKLALEAVRLENTTAALTAWNDLKVLANDDTNRRWFLLAAKMHRELTEKQK